MLAHRVVRFLIVGTINTLFTIAVYQGLLLVMGHVPAYGLSYLAGVTFGYFTYARHVFAARPSPRAFAGFALFYVASGVVGGALNSTLIESLGVHARLAILITVAVMLPVNYLGSRACISLARPREAA
jgi:putative flippase GtrA